MAALAAALRETFLPAPHISQEETQKPHLEELTSAAISLAPVVGGGGAQGPQAATQEKVRPDLST